MFITGVALGSWRESSALTGVCTNGRRRFAEPKLLSRSHANRVSRTLGTERPGAPGARPSLRCKAPSITDERFETEVLQAETPVLVDFYAEWCGPCKLIAPLIDWAATEYSGKVKIFKLDTEQNPKFLMKFGISGLPTLVLLKNGDVVAQHEGAIGKSALVQFLSENLPEIA